MNVWYLVPARAGSKGIPKKNLRILGDKPLINHVVDLISGISEPTNIIVSTDDDSIKSLVKEKCVVHARSSANADDSATLDDVAIEVSRYLLNLGASKDDLLITCQPTSPFLTKATIQAAIQIHKTQNVDTVISVKDDRHLRWSFKNNQAKPQYMQRLNRQELPPVFSETGGLISTSLGHILNHETRIGQRISLVTVEDKEGLDIDTYADWALAEYWVNRRTICIRVDGSNSLGFGHLYRALAIAQSITSHEINFVSRNDGEFDMGFQFLQNFNYPVFAITSNQDFLDNLDRFNPDLVINDFLDTTVNYVQQLKEKGCFVVNFEDLGEGNSIADVVVNDLYPDLYPSKNHWYGVENAILNPYFEGINPRVETGEEVRRILIACGGTDPSNLTWKAIKALEIIDFKNVINVVLGPGNLNYDEIIQTIDNTPLKINLLANVDNMAELMLNSDLAITSAGRTVTELMSARVPTLAMCQNTREMRHNHASSNYGIVNLGMGQHISAEVLADHIHLYLNDGSLRMDMCERMSNAVKNRSNKKVIDKIMNAYKSRNI